MSSKPQASDINASKLNSIMGDTDTLHNPFNKVL